MSPGVLRAVVYVGGVVGTAAGAHTAIAGARSLPGKPSANPSVESDLRFYGVFYAAYGLSVLRLAERADRDPAAVRSVAATLFCAGVARAGGWLATGRPHRGQIALLAVELAAPPLVLAAQSRLSAAPAP